MRNESKQHLALKLFSLNRRQINLLDHLGNESDVVDFACFLDGYIARYGNVLYRYDLDRSLMFISDPLMRSVLPLVLRMRSDRFEKLSAIICQVLGYEFIKVTKRSHDQGVDFIAYKEVAQSFLYLDRKGYLIGQAKKYEGGLVGTSEIRELAGSIMLFKVQEFSTKVSPYQSYKVRSFTPLQVIFIASHFFSEDSERLCNNADIICVDIIDIITLLVLAIRSEILPCAENGYFSSIQLIDNIDSVEVHVEG